MHFVFITFEHMSIYLIKIYCVDPTPYERIVTICINHHLISLLCLHTSQAIALGICSDSIGSHSMAEVTE